VLSFGGKMDVSLFQMMAFVFAGCFVALVTGSLRLAYDDIRDREQRLRFVAAAMPEILFTANAVGHMESLSERFTEYTRKTLADVGLWGWLELLHTEEKEETLVAWKQAVQDKAEFRSTSRLLCHDGYRWFQCRAIPMHDKQQHVIRWFGVCADIDEHKQMEDTLEARTRALSRSNEELERFAFAASHDLQEPLRMVGVFSDLLIRKYPLEDSDSAYLVEQVRVGVQTMRELIDASLEYSVLVSEGIGERTMVNLDEPLSEALAALKETIDQARAAVICEAMPPVPADSRMMTRVFQNLISNAIKFRGAQAPVVKISAVSDGDFWTIAVKDHGIGMPEASHEIIFRAFRRLHWKADYPGSGLGLATVKRIVELHQGQIRVESSPGNGSTFFVTLPAALP
jgi:PAS domain S-box-containing protein